MAGTLVTLSSGNTQKLWDSHPNSLYSLPMVGCGFFPKSKIYKI